MSIVKVPVTIVSDANCPWSFVGYNLLSNAFAQMAHRYAPVIDWIPCQFSSDIKQGGEPLQSLMLRKSGISSYEFDVFFSQLRGTCDDLKINFDFTKDIQVYSSTKANKLSLWLRNTPYQTTLNLAIYRAAFESRLAIDDDDVLLALVAEAGLDVNEARNILSSKACEKNLKVNTQEWRQKGMSQTPVFIIGEQFILCGPQKKSCFFSVLKELNKKSGATLQAA